MSDLTQQNYDKLFETTRKEIEQLSDVNRALDLLNDRLCLESALMQEIHALITESDMELAIKHFLCVIGSYYQGDCARLIEVSLEQEICLNTFAWYAEGTKQDKERSQLVSLDLIREWFPRLRLGEAICSFPEKNREGTNTPLNNQTDSGLLAVPLIQDDALVGLVCVENPRQRVSDPTLLYVTTELIVEKYQKGRLIKDLEHMNYTDLLTGLGSRSQYTKVIEQYRQDPPETLGVILADLNGLKSYNEQLGHDAGDRLLRQCAKIFEGIGFEAFRLGADEFMLLCPNVDRESLYESELKLRRELTALAPITVAVGTTWGEKYPDVQQVMLDANDMLNAEKQVFYRHSVGVYDGHHTGLAAEVLRDLSNDRFEVYYQPQIDLKTGSIYGAEALIRKRDAQGKLIPPNQFVPLYESEGCISHLDLFVLEHVCASMSLWRSTLHQMPHISVNFSRVTLQESNVVETIKSICESFKVPPSYITIEITESTGKLSSQQLKRLVDDLREAGFSVALDDFGASYSNLFVLTYVDFQCIKLDKSLIDNLGQHQKNTMIVKDFIHICRETLSTSSLAEGVETAEQADLLRSFACDFAQGYYYSKPVPEKDFIALLLSGKVYSNVVV